MERKLTLIYARGFPYGAPLLMFRGGATRDTDFRRFIKEQLGFSWDDGRFAYVHYHHQAEAIEALNRCKEAFPELIIKAKSDLDENYLLPPFIERAAH